MYVYMNMNLLQLYMNIWIRYTCCFSCPSEVFFNTTAAFPTADGISLPRPSLRVRKLRPWLEDLPFWIVFRLSRFCLGRRQNPVGCWAFACMLFHGWFSEPELWNALVSLLDCRRWYFALREFWPVLESQRHMRYDSNRVIGCLGCRLFGNAATSRPGKLDFWWLLDTFGGS